VFLHSLINHLFNKPILTNVGPLLHGKYILFYLMWRGVREVGVPNRLCHISAMSNGTGEVEPHGYHVAMRWPLANDVLKIS
jgi:hypothetical protein